MQPASEKCSYLEELSCEEDSLKKNQFCFNQKQDNMIAGKLSNLGGNYDKIYRI